MLDGGVDLSRDDTVLESVLINSLGVEVGVEFTLVLLPLCVLDWLEFSVLEEL